MEQKYCRDCGHPLDGDCGGYFHEYGDICYEYVMENAEYPEEC